MSFYKIQLPLTVLMERDLTRQRVSKDVEGGLHLTIMQDEELTLFDRDIQVDQSVRGMEIDKSVEPAGHDIWSINEFKVLP